MIEVKNVTKNFGDFNALKNVDLTIEEGSICGLVGINGSGKSTLLRIISGIYEPDEGEVLVDGEVSYENENAKRKIFFLPDTPYNSIHLTAKSLIEIYQPFYDFDIQVYKDYLARFSLPFDVALHNFSKGMKRQVFIALALTLKPKYLLLDEAFDGLDPLARLTFKKELVNLVSETKGAVFISSHSLRELEDICDTYALINNKMVASSGLISASELKYHKYQVVFENECQLDKSLFKALNIENDGRIYKIVCKENKEELSKIINDYHPLIIDELPIDFEELFILEVENRGYLK